MTIKKEKNGSLLRKLAAVLMIAALCVCVTACGADKEAADPGAVPAESTGYDIPLSEDPMIIDRADFDIDGDGEIEDCAMSLGPTSGVFTVVITASARGRVKYKNTFMLEHGTLSFERKDGRMMLKKVRTAYFGSPEETSYLGLSVKDGNIVIDGPDDDFEAYWGGEEWNPNLTGAEPQSR